MSHANTNHCALIRVYPVALVVNNTPANERDIGDVDLIRGSGRSLRGGLETHTSILAWRIPWTNELGCCSPRGLEKLVRTEMT